jgi:hypothetical protein
MIMNTNQDPGPETRKLTSDLLVAYLEAGRPPVRQVAKQTDGELSATTVYRMLKATRPPKLRNLLILLAALGVPDDELPRWRLQWSMAVRETSQSPGDACAPLPHRVQTRPDQAGPDQVRSEGVPVVTRPADLLHRTEPAGTGDVDRVDYRVAARRLAPLIDRLANGDELTVKQMADVALAGWQLIDGLLNQNDRRGGSI